MQYKDQVKRQKKEKEKLVEVEGIEEWEVEKISNKRKVRGVTKYLVWQKGFTAENNSWKKEENLKNTKEKVIEFEGRMNMEIKYKRNQMEQRRKTSEGQNCQGSIW